MQVKERVPRPANGVKHELIGSVHKSIIAELFAEHYGNPYSNPSEIRKCAYEKFKKKFPDVRCTLEQFSTFAENRGITCHPPRENKIHKDRIWEIFKTHYRPHRKLAFCREVYLMLKQEQKYCAEKYIREFYDEYSRIHGLKEVPDHEFNQEWDSSYDQLLLNFYFKEENCGMESAEKYIDDFCQTTGKAFSPRLIKNKLLDILPKPSSNPLLDIDKIDRNLLNLIIENIKDFQKRGMDKPTIIKKLQFLLQAEGYQSTQQDIQDLLSNLKKKKRI